MNPEEAEAKAVVGLDPWGLRRIEKLLVDLDGVGSLKIVPDGHGGIEEIHVLTSSTLSPKQIVRNIESALLAHFGLQVDHRKISVARLRSPEISQQPAGSGDLPVGAPEPEVAPAAAERRTVLKSLHIDRATGQRVTCRVELDDAGTTHAGEAEGPDFEKSRLEVAGQAVLEALQLCCSEGVNLALQSVSRVESQGHAYVVAAVGAAEGRRGITLAGIAHVTDSPEEAAVLACLHATNRWLAAR
ncbi:MAG: hypothetical protein RRA92_03080 [Gemmatimonadota bacterium]|nr:hypothetical protein [Gemmatimonadota bacterium]